MKHAVVLAKHNRHQSFTSVGAVQTRRLTGDDDIQNTIAVQITGRDSGCGIPRPWERRHLELRLAVVREQNQPLPNGNRDVEHAIRVEISNGHRRPRCEPQGNEGGSLEGAVAIPEVNREVGPRRNKNICDQVGHRQVGNAVAVEVRRLYGSDGRNSCNGPCCLESTIAFSQQCQQRRLARHQNVHLAIAIQVGCNRRQGRKVVRPENYSRARGESTDAVIAEYRQGVRVAICNHQVRVRRR